jgi:hypothetical protein
MQIILVIFWLINLNVTFFAIFYDRVFSSLLGFVTIILRVQGYDLLLTKSIDLNQFLS